MSEEYKTIQKLHREEIILSALPFGQLIRLLSYCVCEERACLDNSLTRAWAEKIEAEISLRVFYCE